MGLSSVLRYGMGLLPMSGTGLGLVAPSAPFGLSV